MREPRLPQAGPPLLDACRTAVLALLALLLASLGLWSLLPAAGSSAALPDASGQRFPCLSYAPFRTPGSSPNDQGVIIPAQAIARDLAQLATVTGCVRTYGTANGLDAVPEIARTLGLRVWLGAWIGSDPQLNRIELERALALTQAYPDVVDRLIVGSETLLRGELAPSALADLLAEARRHSPVPVAYADVWEFWLKYQTLLQPQVDQAVVHILPYWEDQPVAVKHAVDHVLDVYAQMQARLAPLPVLIGETGWPAAGRMREGARPGSVEQTRFLRELLLRADALPLNVIEAFDQPWKASLEGVAGAAWGIFRSDGSPRYVPAGPVPGEAPAAGICATVGALCMWLLSLAMQRRGAGGWSLTIATAAGLLIGLLASLPLRELWLLAPASSAFTVRIALLITAWIWAALEALALADAAAGTRTVPPALRRVRLGGLAGACVGAGWLLADGRYLDLAWPLLAAPVLLLWLQRFLTPPVGAATGTERVLALHLAAGAAGIVLSEGWHNWDALALAALMLALAAASARMRSARLIAERV